MSMRIRTVSSGSILFATKPYKYYRNLERTAWILMRLRGCAGSSGSMLVANALDTDEERNLLREHYIKLKEDDKFYKRVMDRSIQRLVEDLDPTPVLDLFLETQYMSEDEVQELQSSFRRAREIVRRVRSRGAEGYRKFKILLSKSQQQHLVDHLESMEKEIRMTQGEQEAGRQNKKMESPTLKLENQRVIDDKELALVAQSIGSNWEMLGVYLGLPTVTIEQIKVENQTTALRIYRMLYIWRANNGEDATLENLIKQMEKAERDVVIDSDGIRALKPKISSEPSSHIEKAHQLKMQTAESPEAEVKQEVRIDDDELRRINDITKKLELGDEMVLGNQSIYHTEQGVAMLKMQTAESPEAEVKQEVRIDDDELRRINDITKKLELGDEMVLGNQSIYHTEQGVAMSAEDPGRSVDTSLVALELARASSYSSFREVLQRSFGSTSGGWSQVAWYFHLIKNVIGVAGQGTPKANTVKEYALQFFYNEFSESIVKRGGWESVLDDSSDSELD